MLSRIADALFWTARCMERAEDTARILDVNYHMLLEGARDAHRVRWEPLIAIVGERERFFACYTEATPASVAEFLGFRPDNPNSIVACVSQARENARAIRDRLSREMWEDLNSLYHEVTRFPQDEVLTGSPHRFCNLVKLGSHRFGGVTAATLPRDEGWSFLQAGQALERAEMTARIVDVQYHRLLEGLPPGGEPDNHQWMAVLRSVAAYEFYRRQYRSRIVPEQVAALLVLHPRHPRSVRFNAAALEGALRAVSGTGPDAYANEAERLAGRLHDALKYDRIEDIFARGLHAYLDQVQRGCREIGDQIARSYFHYAVGT
jgi:uncharacterized alpha-E superfamily protein